MLIQGSIVNGNFVPSLPTVPNALQIIPLDSTLGNSTGVIKQISCGADINVITVFSPPPTAIVTGLRGSPFPPIPVVNNPVTNCATATFQPFGSASVILGSVVGGNFVPNPTSGVGGAAPIIPFDAQLGTSSGILNQSSCGVSVNVVTRFGDPVPASSSVASSSAVGSSQVNSSSIASSSLLSSSVVSSSSKTTGGTITITPTSSSSATPVVVIPKPILKTPKDLKITINDPYLCNDDIYGSIVSEDNSKALVTITLTIEGARDGKGTIVFNPELDSSGNYRIKIDHNNPNSRFYIPDGVYTVNYSLRLKGQSGYTNQSGEDQYIEGKPYQAYIINPDKCNPITVPFTNLELPRTGGVMAGQFGILVMLIIGMVWVGEGKLKLKK